MLRKLVSVLKLGNSFAIIIPKIWADSVGLTPKERLLVEMSEDLLTIKRQPVRPKIAKGGYGSG
jgi:antitoxin component of MazEF toxin-antitoxin module